MDADITITIPNQPTPFNNVVFRTNLAARLSIDFGLSVNVLQGSTRIDGSERVAYWPTVRAEIAERLREIAEGNEHAALSDPDAPTPSGQWLITVAGRTQVRVTARVDGDTLHASRLAARDVCARFPLTAGHYLVTVETDYGSRAINHGVVVHANGEVEL